MRPFNLEEYLKNPNRELVTRNGRSARIICTDRKDVIYPIVALVSNNSDEEKNPMCYTEEGKFYPNGSSNSDLFFATKKREGWINICSNLTEKDAYCGKMIHPTKADAKCFASNAIATIKIEWEE